MAEKSQFPLLLLPLAKKMADPKGPAVESLGEDA